MWAALLTRLAPWRTLAVCSVVAALALMVYIEHLRLTAEQATSAGRLATIRAFEASTAALRADAALREKASQGASRSAARMAANAQRQIESIQRAPLPEDCAGAVKWLVDQGPVVEGQP